jgi:hypothetical protein
MTDPLALYIQVDLLLRRLVGQRLERGPHEQRDALMMRLAPRGSRGSGGWGCGTEAVGHPGDGGGRGGSRVVGGGNCGARCKRGAAWRRRKDI